MSICSCLVSCGNLSKKQKMIKPKEVWGGQAGQEPQHVWNDYNWLIVNSDRFICVEK